MDTNTRQEGVIQLHCGKFRIPAAQILKLLDFNVTPRLSRFVTVFPNFALPPARGGVCAISSGEKEGGAGAEV